MENGKWKMEKMRKGNERKQDEKEEGERRKNGKLFTVDLIKRNQRLQV
jgi:hypothetical protein